MIQALLNPRVLVLIMIVVIAGFLINTEGGGLGIFFLGGTPYSDDLKQDLLDWQCSGTSCMSTDGKFAVYKYNSPPDGVLRSIETHSTDNCVGVTGFGSSTPLAAITMTNIVQGSDYKFDYSAAASTSTSGSFIPGTVTFGTCSKTLSRTGAVEIRSKDLDPTRAVMVVDSKENEACETNNFGQASISAGVGGSGDVSATLSLCNPEVKFEFNCQVNDNELMAVETFNGGRDLNVYSFRYPATKFCLDNPVIISDPAESGFKTTAEPYVEWASGETLPVPSGQTWTAFYIFNAQEAGITDRCEDYYSIDDDACTDLSVGIVQVCSEGVFDPDMYACVITPETQSVCERGVYDITLEKCVVFVGDVVCESPDAIYDPSIDRCCISDTGSCVKPLDSTLSCLVGDVFNPLTGQCEDEGGSSYPALTPAEACTDSGGSFDSGTGACVLPGDFVCPDGFDFVSGDCVLDLDPEVSFFDKVVAWIKDFLGL